MSALSQNVIDPSAGKKIRVFGVRHPTFPQNHSFVFLGKLNSSFRDSVVVGAVICQKNVKSKSVARQSNSAILKRADILFQLIFTPFLL